ncbi:hypothetical protein H0X10_03440 [Candidatus Saccharibacteria bacterium]|nr:hypothetical protein [Candidatus Saccharibacteria bacterium]
MLNLNIAELNVSSNDHNSTARVHLSEYLGHAAQAHIDSLVASNKDIASATLISESQTIVIEAARSTTDPETLKDIVHGFMSAIKQWHSELGTLQTELVSFHPNPRRDEHFAHSRVNTDY